MFPVKFKVLGPFDVHNDAQTIVTPTAPKLRTVLSLFVTNHNRVVPVSSLIEEIWAENPPISAMTTLQTYVYQLRKLFAASARQNADNILITKPLGYVAAIDPEDIDLCIYSRLAQEGRLAISRGEIAEGAKSLEQALSLWRGAALVDVQRGQLLEAQATQLDESMRQNLVLRIDADLQLGRHQSLTGELRRLAGQYPLYEDLHAKLMLALYRSNWKSAALEAFHELRRVLDRELGIDPSPALKRLHQDILADAPHIQFHETVTARAVIAAPKMTPAQLPSGICDFVGRRAELKEIHHLIEAPREAPWVISLSGLAGIGKTTLAVRAAHQAQAGHTDGQFFFYLGGSTERPADPVEVLGRFLRSVGFDDAEIPDSLEERVSLFRTWTAPRAGLLVLDDAASTSMVRPLLPAGVQWTVLITSQRPLGGLAGARHIQLRELSVSDGTHLLRNILGNRRVVEEEGEAARIVRLCNGLPVAIRTAGQRLAAATHWQLAHFRQRLADPTRRLTELSNPEVDLRSLFAASYGTLDASERAALHRIADNRDICIPHRRAPRLLGMQPREAEETIQRLADANILHVNVPPDQRSVEYRLPSLFRLYVRERSASRARPVTQTGLHRPGVIGGLIRPGHLRADPPAPSRTSRRTGRCRFPLP